MFQYNKSDIRGYIPLPLAYAFYSYAHDDLIALKADDGNHFIEYGITKYSLLYIDLEKEYSSDGLYCFYKTNNDGSKNYKLSKEKPIGYQYVGKLVCITKSIES